MFDITSSKLLILGIVALLVIGPKDLPALLRTIGKYVGIIKKHAAEFRAQFDEAIRESELEDLKKEVEKIGHEAESSVREAADTAEKQVADASESVDSAMEGADAKSADAKPDVMAHNADGLPLAGPGTPASSTAGALNGAAPEDAGSGRSATNETAGEPRGTGVKTEA
jgi:sec-independent protein translocase protein TatB